MSLINGIHHVAIKCEGEEQLGKVLDFYVGLLGLREIRRWEGGAMLDTGAGCIEVFANAKSPLPQGALRHIALATNDVDTCARRVAEAGYEVFIQPGDIAIPSVPVFHARMAFCTGPVGEQIEFFKEK